MKPHIRFIPGILAAGLIALLNSYPAWAQTNSHARVVRLSFVEGKVNVQRPDVQAWADAPVNTPLQEGFQLSTGENSFAEVEFENGGTICLGEFSLLDLTVLELAPNGGHINHVDIRQGYGTFHPLPSRVEQPLQVGTPLGTLIAEGGAKFRVDLDQSVARVEVFKGSVQVQSSLGDITIDQDSALVLQPGSSDPTVVSQGITRDDWDNWVDDREANLEMPPTGPSPDTYDGDEGGATYGWSDLLHYGTWSNVPGAGFGWTPNMATSPWSPYANGQWCWYPGYGYTWIGAEPWGWLPYHYGSWEYLLGNGWVWFPSSLRTWSPGRVTWFHGDNWVGWVPHSHLKGNSNGCGDNCGGGVESTAAFRHGGRLTSNRMLNVNPTSGEMVKDPGIIPSTTAKLTGPAVPFPAAQSRSPGARSTFISPGAAISAPATTAAGTRHTGSLRPEYNHRLRSPARTVTSIAAA